MQYIFAIMDKKVAEKAALISYKLVPFIVLPRNPLKLCNAIDEEWRQEGKKRRRREKRSKLTAWKSK
jgi:hypothetical protein